MNIDGAEKVKKEAPVRNDLKYAMPSLVWGIIFFESFLLTGIVFLYVFHMIDQRLFVVLLILISSLSGVCITATIIKGKRNDKAVCECRGSEKV
jgi:hypothetical protein